MKYKLGQVIARLYCEPCCEERYVIIQERATWRCEGCGLALIPCNKCRTNWCGECDNGSLFEFDDEIHGSP